MIKHFKTVMKDEETKTGFIIMVEGILVGLMIGGFITTIFTL